jgi:hypothetical protein
MQKEQNKPGISGATSFQDRIESIIIMAILQSYSAGIIIQTSIFDFS